MSECGHDWIATVIGIELIVSLPIFLLVCGLGMWRAFRETRPAIRALKDKGDG